MASLPYPEGLCSSLILSTNCLSLQYGLELILSMHWIAPKFAEDETSSSNKFADSPYRHIVTDIVCNSLGINTPRKAMAAFLRPAATA